MPITSYPITTIGNCNTAFSMMVIGMILADADIMSLFNFEVLRYSLLRLIIMPAVLFGICILLGVPSLVTGVCVILTAMPAGATTSILASKYGCDEIFVTKLVVASTILSMVTIPVCSILLILSPKKHFWVQSPHHLHSSLFPQQSLKHMPSCHFLLY